MGATTILFPQGGLPLIDFTQQILQFITAYGPAALFLVLFLDSTMLLPFIPGELVVVVATHRFAHDHASLFFLILVVTAATTTGALVLFLLAKHGGRRFIEAHPRLFLMSPQTRDRLERAFQRPLGQSLVFFFRLIPLLRILVSLPAGLARMPLLRFLILTAAGNFLFNAGVMGLTYESTQPNSVVAAYARLVHDAYAAPLWLFIKSNWLVIAAVVLGLAIFLSLVRSARTLRHPERPSKASVLGTLATTLLVGGGAAILVGLWNEPQLVYDTIGLTGWDVQESMAYEPGGPLVMTALLGGLLVFFGLIIAAIRQSARSAVKAHKRRALQEERAAAAAAAATRPRT